MTTSYFKAKEVDNESLANIFYQKKDNYNNSQMGIR